LGEKCLAYEMFKAGKRKLEVVEKYCQTRQLNKENAVDRGKWRKLIKD